MMRILILLLITSSLMAHEVTLRIKISCDMCEELQAFIDSIPHQQSTDYPDWKNHFSASMTKFMTLIESGKVDKATWKVNTATQLTAKNDG